MRSSAVLLAAALIVPAARAGEAPFPEDQVVSSSHFRLHFQSPYPPAGVLNVLEGLYARLMLDLQPFAPWTDRAAIDVYLYRDGESYRAHTGAPAWAAAHADAAARRIHAYEGEEFQRYMAHEMGHLFFETFFRETGSSAPLWLNEGVATLMEWDYGLGEDMRAADSLTQERPSLPLAEFLQTDYHHRALTQDQATEWYWQAASLARFLMRRFSSLQFKAFCDALRRGESLDAALLKGYGLQMPDAPALERLWRKNLNDLRGNP